MLDADLPLIFPDWPAPQSIRACVTTRMGGVSCAPFDQLNLGTHVGDDPQAVAENRARLRAVLPTEPAWLNQIHGIQVVRAEQVDCHQPPPDADASVTSTPNQVCVVMTADCLPVLLCNRAGTVVGAAHAGWRGLLAGVIEATINAMEHPPEQLMAWLGPAIGPQAFEVGEEVRMSFIADLPASVAAFRPSPNKDKWLADIYQLARLRLLRAGVIGVHGGHSCTVSDSERFFSYRRDQQTGRMASLIWIANPD